VKDGYSLFIVGAGLFRGERLAHRRLRVFVGEIMSWIYLLSGVMAAAVFIYLLIALFYPEKF
jgi:K+-transporting ATPase KdpF subunit